MASITVIRWPQHVEIPEIDDLAGFRRWSRSASFPKRGRIDWVGGTLEVDMSPEDLYTHGTVKEAIARTLGTLIAGGRRGVVLIDSTRLSSDDADLSVEPDVVVVLRETLEAGRVRQVPKAGEAEGRYVELEGAADLVVECLSDSSVAKDTRALPSRYHRAGVREYWVVDARAGTELRIHRRAEAGYELVAEGADGFTLSEILGVAVRLERVPLGAQMVVFDLVVRSEG